MSQVWLITGASGGLGRAIADAALAAGHSVVATDRSGASDSPDAQFEDRLLVLPLDVNTPEERAYDSVVEEAVARFGRIDVLVNSAGYGLLTHFEETDEAQVRAQFETNVFGLMRVTRAVLPVMRRQRFGHIVNISSLSGYVGGPAGSIYSASKFAVTGFTESLAAELEPFGITATNVAPGYFRTDFLSAARHSPAHEVEDYESSRAAIESFVEEANHTQPGDPAALGRLLVEIVGAERPPVHLPIGADAIDAIEQHERDLAADIDAWREKAIATTHETDIGLPG